MNGDYSIFNNSMNGVITLSDGVSFISDGKAQHENIIYTSFIKSGDELTTLTNNSLNTNSITTTSLNATTISANSEILGTLTVTNLNVDNYGFYVDGFGNTISSSLPYTMNNSLKVVGNELTLENGNINQIGTTSLNTLKSTSINGSLTCQSDLIQTGGNTVLKNITADNVTMNSNKSIFQSGSGVGNSLGSTQVSNLVVTTSMTFPSNVTIPSASQTGDLTFTGGARIIQDLTEAGTNYNTLMYSKIAKLDIDGNLVQNSGTTNLLNTVVAGTLQIQGDITQTAGQSVFKAIGCDQLTLSANKDLFFTNGTGKIDQSVSSGTNMLNAITMNANRNLTQSGTGILSQSGTGTNALKNTSVTGTLAVSSSTTLTGNVDIGGTLSLSANRSIIQPTGTTSNQFQNTAITNLTCPTGNITNLTTTSLSVGNVSNVEIQFLDGVTSNIQSQIDNISSTTTGNAASLNGISYISGTDTTLVDNNLTVSTGKTFLVGTTDVGTNIISLNTSVTNINTNITSLLNITNGINYTSANDTTRFNNNVTLTTGKTLIVDGMDIKAEIDALESSFTTGTLNSTTATITNLSSTTFTAATATITNLSSTTFTTANSTIDTLLTAANATINTLLTAVNATITNLTATTATMTTITSPSNANMNINTASGRNLNINCNKGNLLGDVYINTGSNNSNAYIDRGDLVIGDGNCAIPNGYMSSSQIITDVIQVSNIYPTSLTTTTNVKTRLIADIDKPIMSPNTYVGCWVMNGGLGSLKIDSQYPIMCSLKYAGLVDDLFIVCPGYKIVLYRYEAYTVYAGGQPVGPGTFQIWPGTTDLERQTRTLDNTNGTTCIVSPSVDIYGSQNQVWSCKLYYRGTEIQFPYYS